MGHRPTGLFVEGQWRESDQRFTVTDKYLREPIAELAVAGPAQVDAAVGAARRAADDPLPPARRERILLDAAELLEERAAEIERTYVAETGFTLADARTESARAVGTLRLCAGEAVRVAGQEIPVSATPGSENRLAFTIRVPVGVVGAIAPFNAPLNTVAHKIGPALAAGNAVVLKPAEATPLCSIALVEALHDAGLPPGFLQLVCGPGETTGAALVADRRIRYFTFTGSSAVGLLVKQRSGIAKTHLELGANSASLVGADADLDLVAELVARAGFRKAGQVCTSVQRLLVHREVLDELTERLTARITALRVGDPRDPKTDVGPMIAPAEAQRAREWITEPGGGRVLCGGERDGALLSPALVAEPAPDSHLMCTEIFAPVVAVVPVESMDRAIELMNAGDYGLQAGIFTRDLDRAFDAARRLRVGGVMVNDTSSYHADAMPYGGVKDSGYGVEGPRYAVEDMTDPRIVVFNLRPPRS
ncbi:aldehyde dehydrogenase family protein [Nocardia alni]|uniref:aldehyde dehydrogenase family protein n=1 Tax=Nocardia alni TaxID=2815723 RepID=UPI001C23DF11|nr:aldehyde dehydrogenase family protein [Nocardia alni]